MKIKPLLAIAAVLVLAGCGAGKPDAGLPEAARPLRDRLLTQGFKPDPSGSYDVVMEHARLADAARIVGFSPADLTPTPSQSIDSDIRTATIGLFYILVYSEVRDGDGRIVAGSLDNPEAICTVRVAFLPGKTEKVKNR